MQYCKEDEVPEILHQLHGVYAHYADEIKVDIFSRGSDIDGLTKYSNFQRTAAKTGK